MKIRSFVFLVLLSPALACAEKYEKQYLEESDRNIYLDAEEAAKKLKATLSKKQKRLALQFARSTLVSNP